MKIYQNLTIVGTSHISKQSIEEVKEVISTQNPEILALELDKGRLNALVSDQKRKIGIRDIRQFGFKGFLFGAIGQWAEHKLGKIVEVSPGTEMLEAFKLGKQFNCKVALIDQDISITLKNLSKEITWKEKFRFLYDIIKGIFIKEDIKFDLHKVPSNKIIKEMLDKVKIRYPSIYKVIVTDRNIYMAKRLYMLMNNYESVVAVIGAGHVDEIIKEIKCLQENK